MQTFLNKEIDPTIFSRAIEKPLGYSIAFPRETVATMINWFIEGAVRVSVVLPEKERNIISQWYRERPNREGERWFAPPQEITIKTPMLILSTLYGQNDDYDLGPMAINPYGHGWMSRNEVHIVQMNTESKGKIEVRPYRLANIYEKGTICWGGNHCPPNLKDINNVYWSSPMNVDFNGPKCGARCTEKNHKYQQHMHNQPISVHRHHHVSFCQKMTQGCKASQDHVHGIICSVCKGVRKEKLYSYRKKINLRPIIRAMRSENKLCICCMDLCSDLTCFCNCHCCNGNCGCPCACDYSDLWAKELQDYTKILEIKHEGKWENWTKFFLGNVRSKKFMCYEGQMSGLFVSYEDNFVKKFSKYAKEHGRFKAVFGIITKENAKTFEVLISKEDDVKIKIPKIQAPSWGSPTYSTEPLKIPTRFTRSDEYKKLLHK